MYCEDVTKLSLIFTSLADRLSEKASTMAQIKKARQKAVMFDTPFASVFAVLGLYRIDQYQKLMSKAEWEAVTNHCQWEEDNCVWVVKLNENIENEIKDTILRNKLVGYE
jgi:hypothetical protein